MAIIDFQILGQSDGDPSLETLSGSGLGFFGATAGSSVQIGSYQDSTYVSNGDGSVTKGQTNNIKFTADTFPSGMATTDAIGGTYGPVGLSGIKTFESTLGVRFGHTTAVKTQNVQLRIYDRSNINHPASGVNTKVAEVCNWGAGGTYDSQGAAGVGSNAVGSGDAFWWGEPWPAQLVTKNYWTNSLGTKFYNGTDDDAVVNGDARLDNVTDDDLSVGGSGLVVPLLDSPGSGQRGLDEVTGATGMIWPKWTQYIASANQATYGGNAKYSFGDGTTAGNLLLNQGGTGYHTHHTWGVALSASPLNIGSKEQYGLYVSLEYL